MTTSLKASDQSSEHNEETLGLSGYIKLKSSFFKRATKYWFELDYLAEFVTWSKVSNLDGKKCLLQK